MKDIVSVITTFYNAQDYILKCLNSVNNQLINEFFEIEFVLVDDCSTDDTLKIANEYAQNDKRIRILHKAGESNMIFHIHFFHSTTLFFPFRKFKEKRKGGTCEPYD